MTGEVVFLFRFSSSRITATDDTCPQLVMVSRTSPTPSRREPSGASSDRSGAASGRDATRITPSLPPPVKAGAERSELGQFRRRERERGNGDNPVTARGVWPNEPVARNVQSHPGAPARSLLGHLVGGDQSAVDTGADKPAIGAHGRDRDILFNTRKTDEGIVHNLGFEQPLSWQSYVPELGTTHPIVGFHPPPHLPPPPHRPDCRVPARRMPRATRARADPVRPSPPRPPRPAKTDRAGRL